MLHNYVIPFLKKTHFIKELNSIKSNCFYLFPCWQWNEIYFYILNHMYLESTSIFSTSTDIGFHGTYGFLAAMSARYIATGAD